MEVPLPGSSNITFSAEFEWELAAQWRGYKTEEFTRLSGDEQSRIVAVFRLYHRMNAVMQWQQVKAARAGRRAG